MMTNTLCQFLIIGGLLLSSVSIAAPHQLEDLYVKNISLTLKNKKQIADVQKAQKIIYGSKKIGYFTTTHHKVKKNKLVIKNFLPPTYKQPVYFFIPSITNSSGYSLVGKLKFKNPTPPAIASVKPYYLSGSLPSPYIMMSVSIPKAYLNALNSERVAPDREKKNSNRFSFLVAYNRELEVVWAHAPNINGEHLYSYVAFRKTQSGQYGYVLGKKDGLFAEIDFMGNDKNRVIGKRARKSFPMHHDFEFLDNGTILTISNRYAKLRGMNGKRRLFLSNTIIGINPDTGKPKLFYDFLKDFRPSTVGHWQENKFKPRFVTWDSQKADHDFVHANSIAFYENQGLLVSLKHLDKVVLIDPSFKKLAWSLGPTAKDTFTTRGKTKFSHQHDAQLMDDGSTVVLFDNGFHRKKSRILALSLDKKNKRVRKKWEFTPTPPMYAENRGGIDQISEDIFLAHFVSPDGWKVKQPKLTMDQDVIIGFNAKTGKTVCEMIVPFRTRSAGYRSYALDTIGFEKYFGASLTGDPKILAH